MANDRLFVRCTKCGDYLAAGKYFPSSGLTCQEPDALVTFITSHLDNCQPTSVSYEGPICLVFDSEETLHAAGGFVGGTGNTGLDQSES